MSPDTYDRGLLHLNGVAVENELALVYAIDLDGCIAEGVWPQSMGIGAPIEANVEKLRKVAERHQIFIHTARPWGDYPVIINWLNDHNIPFTGVVCGKLMAYRYVDDKAVNSEDAEW